MLQEIKVLENEKLGKNRFQPDNRIKATSKLRESIRATKGNMYVPALVQNGILVDGHRRYEACMLEGVPFYYIDIIGEVPVGFIRVLNETGRQWSTKNYIASHAANDEAYRKLWEFIQVHKIPVSLINSFCNYSEAMLVAGADIKRINYNKLSFRVKVYNHLKSLYPSVPTNTIHRSLGKMLDHKSFDEKKFWDKITKLETVEESTQEHHWMVKQLSEIYGDVSIYEDIRDESNSRKGK